MTETKRSNWRKMRRGLALKNSLSDFNKEFRRHMATFITGAFSFVAALLWRDAIIEFIKIFEIHSDIVYVKFITALIVSAVAIFVIIGISKISKISNNTE